MSEQRGIVTLYSCVFGDSSSWQDEEKQENASVGGLKPIPASVASVQDAEGKA